MASGVGSPPRSSLGASGRVWPGSMRAAGSGDQYEPACTLPPRSATFLRVLGFHVPLGTVRPSQSENLGEQPGVPARDLCCSTGPTKGLWATAMLERMTGTVSVG
jgi:hypothetical protein